MSDRSSSSSNQPRIAIAGATGRIGSALASLLAADPVDVVALTRNPDAAQMPAGVAVSAVDFERHDSLADALRGVDRLFISHGTSPRQVANEIALIDAAVAAGVRHIVKVSALGPATRLLPLAWHMQVEAHLSLQPVASTALRPSAFMSVLNHIGAQVAAGSWTGAAGTGRVNFIDTRDVAEAARVALIEEVEPGSQRAYHLTGPRSWTMEQVAQELSRLLGRSIVYTNQPPARQREALIAGGASPFVADLLIGLDQMFRESVLGETTSTVEELTGRAPRSLTDWLSENISIFKAS